MNALMPRFSLCSCGSIHGAFLNGWNVGSAENVSKFFGLTSPEMVSWVVKEFGEKAAAAAPRVPLPWAASAP